MNSISRVLVLNVNKNHADQLNVFFHTLIKNGNISDIEFDIKIYTRDLERSDIRVNIINDLEIIRVSDEIFSYKRNTEKVHKLINNEQHINVAPLRLYAMQELRLSYDLMVYMDSDICISGDVTQLFEYSGDDYSLSVTREHIWYEMTPKEHWGKIGHVSGCDNEVDSCTFNNGVMSIPLKKQSLTLVEDFLEYETNRTYEQGFMNEYYDFNSIKWNTYQYNATIKYYWYLFKDELSFQYAAKFDKAHVKHYSGLVKPWYDLDIDIESLDNRKDDKNLYFLSLLNMDEYKHAVLEIEHCLSPEFVKNVKRNQKTHMQAILKWGSVIKKPLCSVPFTTIHQWPSGKVGLCCHDGGYKSKMPTFIYNEFDDIWNSDTMKDVRKQLTNGKLPDVCKDCYPIINDIEMFDGEVDERLIQYGLKPDLYSYENIYEAYNPETGEMKTGIYNLHWAFDSDCNLACKMCHGASSTKINQKLNNKFVMKSPVKDFGQIFRVLERNRDTLKRICIHGGEPMKSHMFIPFCIYVAENMPDLIVHFNTNGTSFSPNKIDVTPYIRRLKNVYVAYSVDSIPEVNNYQRTYSNYTKIVENYEEGRRKLPNARFGLNVALTTLSTYKLSDFVDRILTKNEFFNLDFVEFSYTTGEIDPRDSYGNPALLHESLKDGVENDINNMISDIYNGKYEIKNDVIKSDILRMLKSAIVCMRHAQCEPERWDILVDEYKRYDDVYKLGSFFEVFPEFKLLSNKRIDVRIL